MSEQNESKLSELIARLDDCHCASGGDCGKDCNCGELVENLYELMDYEMPEPDEHRLIRHAANCTYCQDSIKMESVIRAVVKRGCVEDAPESLRVKIYSLVRTTKM